VRAVDDVPDSAPVEFDVRVVDGTVTPEGTAVLEVSVTNTGETEREVTTPYYKGLSDGNPGVLLYSLEALDSPDRDDVPPCIADPDTSHEYVEWTDEGPLSHQLNPGTTATDELVLASDPTVDGCFPPGEYRFEDHHSVDGDYYEAGVTEEGDREMLTLGLVEPRVLPQERPVKIEHGFCGRRIITLELVATDGTVLVDRTRELLPGAEVEFGRTDRVGNHELQVTVADGGETTAELTGTARIDESRFSVVVVVEHDGITPTGAVARLGICQYDG